MLRFLFISVHFVCIFFSYSQSRYQANIGYNYKFYNRYDNYLNTSGIRFNNIYQLEPNTTSIIFNLDLIWSRKHIEKDMMSMGGYPKYTYINYTKNEFDLEFGVLMHLRSKDNKKFINFGLNLNGIGTELLKGTEEIKTPFYQNNTVYYETINNYYDQKPTVFANLKPNIRIEYGWINNLNSKLIGNIKIGAEIGRFFILLGIDKKKIIVNKSD